MKQEHIVLTFDVGTQSSRAMLINSRGDILAKAQETHEPPYDSPEPGFAEQRADFYYEHIYGIRPSVWMRTAVRCAPRSYGSIREGQKGGLQCHR